MPSPLMTAILKKLPLLTFSRPSWEERLQERRTEELELDLLVLDSVRLPLKRRVWTDETPLVKRPATDGDDPPHDAVRCCMLAYH